MAQNYDKPFIYKGVEVRPAPKRVAQEWPNVAQIEVAQVDRGQNTSSTRVASQRCQSVPYQPDFSGVGSAIGGFLGGIVSGFKSRRNTSPYAKLRKEMEQTLAADREYIAGCNALARKHRGGGSCKSSGSPTINVYGGTANITINNY